MKGVVVVGAFILLLSACGEGPREAAGPAASEGPMEAAGPAASPGSGLTVDGAKNGKPTALTELPVVALVLPAGKVDASRAKRGGSGTYRVDELDEPDGQRGAVVIAWNSQSADTVASMKQRVASTGLDDIEVVETSVNGIPAIQALRVAGGSRPGFVTTSWRCGARNVNLTVHAKGAGAMALHQRIAATVSCRIPVEEATLRPIITIPKGWSVNAAAPAGVALALVNDAKDGHVFYAESPADITADMRALKTFVHSTAKSKGLGVDARPETRQVDVASGGRAVGRATVRGGALVIEASYIPCPTHGTGFVVIGWYASRGAGMPESLFDGACPQ